MYDAEDVAAALNVVREQQSRYRRQMPEQEALIDAIWGATLNGPSKHEAAAIADRLLSEGWGRHWVVEVHVHPETRYRIHQVETETDSVLARQLRALVPMSAAVVMDRGVPDRTLRLVDTQGWTKDITVEES